MYNAYHSDFVSLKSFLLLFTFVLHCTKLFGFKVIVIRALAQPLCRNFFTSALQGAIVVASHPQGPLDFYKNLSLVTYKA